MRKIFVSLFLCALLSQTFGQGASPLSRFGLGYVRSDVFSANKAMGEISAAYSSAIHINPNNPASYADLGLTTYEIGANTEAVSIRTKDSTYSSLRGSLNHIALGSPLVKGVAGWSIGLLPYSNLNYHFIHQNQDTTQDFSGNGSTYKFYVGAGAKFKGFSFGANVGYIFGKLDYTKGFYFNDSLTSLNSINLKNVTSMNVGSFTYNLGVQYRKIIIKKTRENGFNDNIVLCLGLTGSSQMKANTNYSNQWTRYTFYQQSGQVYENVIDTPVNITSGKSKITMPFNLGAGFTLGSEMWWLVGADFKYSGWSQFASPINTDKLANSYRIALGFSIIPNHDAKAFLSRVQYKFGGYYGKNQVIYDGRQVAEVGGTFGFSLPVPFKKGINAYQDFARLHISGDIGNRSNGIKNDMSENFYRFTFGVTFNNRWFIPRKFD